MSIYRKLSVNEVTERKENVGFSGSWQMSLNSYFDIKGRRNRYIEREREALESFCTILYDTTLKKIRCWNLLPWKIWKQIKLSFDEDIYSKLIHYHCRSWSGWFLRGWCGQFLVLVLGLYPTVCYPSHCIVW